MKRPVVMAALMAAPWAVLACADTTPTSNDPGRLPIDPPTIEIVLSFEEFASAVTVYGGFGRADQLGSSVLAHEFDGTLEARTLVRFTPFPSIASVRDSLGTVRPDSSFTYPGGRVVASLDTLSSTNEGPVTLFLERITSRWHPPSASWTLAVDTAGDQEAWPEPGGGPVEPLAELEWDPSEGDSVVFELDSASVAQLGDTLDAARGIRLRLGTPGERIDVRSVLLRLDARPSIHLDTIVELVAFRETLTFVYDPVPAPPPDGIRIGGTPAWRTVLTLDLPRELNGPARLCEVMGCPFQLDPDRINFASLDFTTRTVEPAAFQPTDTVRLDIRPVLAPDRLPKSPLGASFVGALGERVGPEAFGDDPGQTVAIPVTGYVRALAEEDPDDPAPRDLALLSLLEPFSLSFASFDGPGTPGAPRLRLILSAADTVQVN